MAHKRQNPHAVSIEALLTIEASRGLCKYGAFYNFAHAHGSLIEEMHELMLALHEDRHTHAAFEMLQVAAVALRAARELSLKDHVDIEAMPEGMRQHVFVIAEVASTMQIGHPTEVPPSQRYDFVQLVGELSNDDRDALTAWYRKTVA